MPREYGVSQRICTDDGPSFSATGILDLPRLSLEWLRSGIVDCGLASGGRVWRGFTYPADGEVDVRLQRYATGHIRPVCVAIPKPFEVSLLLIEGRGKLKRKLGSLKRLSCGRDGVCYLNCIHQIMNLTKERS